ncbi:MAG: hypothetical protein VZR00_06680 [Lachnospiraceae bacterium]|nr:hypothetical protein [Lachnospiraceae bacterium]
MKQFSWMKQGNVYMPGDTADRLSADIAVILAAGDYSKNKEMCRDLLAETDNLNITFLESHYFIA